LVWLAFLPPEPRRIGKKKKKAEPMKNGVADEIGGYDLPLIFWKGVIE
jgi:hypothetical protein